MLKLATYLIFFASFYALTSFIVSENQSIDLNELATSEGIELSDDTTLYQKIVTPLNADINYKLDLGQEFTAIKISPTNSECEIHLKTDNDEASIGYFVIDEELEVPPNFIIFSEPTQYINIRTSIADDILIELFYAPKVTLPKNNIAFKKTNCLEPYAIPQSDWRSGLPGPIPGRESTEVKHCIIHHAATSNTDTNFVNIIRNIYLLHTQSNGWDDIGYNYVIAQNGEIFAGRDPESIDDQDNIKGAHYCSKNGGTMGVCMLGNYMSQPPPENSLNALVDLLAWKLHKENLTTLDSSVHPINSGSELGSIAFHQHGCATSCPGDSTVPLLQQIKERVQAQIDTCNLVASEPQLVEESVKHRLFPNPNQGRFYLMLEAKYENVILQLRDISGKEVYNSTLAQNGFVEVDLPNGSYSYQAWHKDLRLVSGILQVNK